MSALIALSRFNITPRGGLKRFRSRITSRPRECGTQKGGISPRAVHAEVHSQPSQLPGEDTNVSSSRPDTANNPQIIAANLAKLRELRGCFSSDENLRAQPPGNGGCAN
jgi:hypothetical protein